MKGAVTGVFKMCANQQIVPKAGSQPQARRIVVVADCGAQTRELVAMLRRTSVGEHANLTSMSLSAWLSRADHQTSDVVLVSLVATPEGCVLARLNDRVRSMKLIFVVPRFQIAAWEAMAASRGLGLLAREDICVAGIETAIGALVRARNCEQRLLAVIADQTRMISELRTISGSLSLALEDLAPRWNEAREDCSEGFNSVGVGCEMLGVLQETDAALSSALAEADCSLRSTRAPDLVRVMGALAAPWARAASCGVSVLASEGPIWIDVQPNALNRLLRGFVGFWTRMRSAGDHLELIVWDSGDDARIAAVFSRARTPGAADARASLCTLVRELLPNLKSHVRACHAQIEVPIDANSSAERLSLTIVLPKRGVGPSYAWGAIREASADLVGQHKN